MSCRGWLAAGGSIIAFCFALEASATDIGQGKVAKGQVTSERNRQSIPAPVGAHLQDASRFWLALF